MFLFGKQNITSRGLDDPKNPGLPWNWTIRSLPDRNGLTNSRTPVHGSKPGRPFTARHVITFRQALTGSSKWPRDVPTEMTSSSGQVSGWLLVTGFTASLKLSSVTLFHYNVVSLCIFTSWNLFSLTVYKFYQILDSQENTNINCSQGGRDFHAQAY